MCLSISDFIFFQNLHLIVWKAHAISEKTFAEKLKRRKHTYYYAHSFHMAPGMQKKGTCIAINPNELCR